MISEYTAFLEKAFDILNNHYFEGKLPKPVITIQSSPKAYGHFTTQRIWKDKENSYFEINIGAEYLDRPIENILATLLHEQIHLYSSEVGLATVSHNNRYHNKLFKAEAEKRDLHISYAKYIGYSVTQPTEKFVETLKQYGLLDMDIKHCRGGGMDNGGIKPTITKKPSSTRKYICPCCGQRVRATKEVYILCGYCQIPLEKVDT